MSSMSHVEFKKWQCHPVDFRGQGPFKRRVCNYILVTRTLVDKEVGRRLFVSDANSNQLEITLSFV